MVIILILVIVNGARGSGLRSLRFEILGGLFLIVLTIENLHHQRRSRLSMQLCYCARTRQIESLCACAKVLEQNKQLHFVMYSFEFKIGYIDDDYQSVASLPAVIVI
jgi:hypothetical protein